jgi:hypothetical protein
MLRKLRESPRLVLRKLVTLTELTTVRKRWRPPERAATHPVSEGGRPANLKGGAGVVMVKKAYSEGNAHWNYCDLHRTRRNHGWPAP